jgi:hypothetical protein
MPIFLQIKCGEHDIEEVVETQLLQKILLCPKNNPFNIIREKVSEWIDTKKTMAKNSEALYEIDRDFQDQVNIVHTLPIHEFKLLELFSNENNIKASQPI